ncbi:MAG TPA: class E sortase [Frankiaceae bacterium]|nr:class E sortase [Frankiaceae bacterium]
MRLATFLRGLGQTLITAGVVILLFVAYELWFTGLETQREQDRLTTAIEDEWRHGAGSYATAEDLLRPIPIGSGVAVIRVPRFGRDWARVVVEGVDLRDLRKGPGHYPGTALPGQTGNFVVSGHRTTYGAPFNRVDELKPGDAIVIETRDTWYTYRVTSTEIVRPTAVEVTYPVPKQRDAKPAKPLITLTSCHPKYSARQRFVVYGELGETLAKSAGTPSALAG